jgi:hypothetical protein
MGRLYSEHRGFYVTQAGRYLNFSRVKPAVAFNEIDGD